MAPKIVDRDARKTEIIRAALQAFSRKGFANTKISYIASLAGVGKGTIYEYFRSKNEILSAAYTNFIDTINAQLRHTLGSVDQPVLKLKLLLELGLDYFLNDVLDFPAVMLQFWAEGIRAMDDDVQTIIDLKRIYIDYRSKIAGIVEEGQKRGVFRQIDPVAYASLAIASLDGLLLQVVTDPKFIDPGKIKRVFVDTLLKAIVIDGPI